MTITTNEDFAAVKENGTRTASGNVLTNDSGTSLRIAYVDPTFGGYIFGAYGYVQFFQDGHYLYKLYEDSEALQNLHDGETVQEPYQYVATDDTGFEAQGLLT